MKERYERNIGAISEDEANILRTKKICVIGSGGLGGFILEELLRIGVGCITIVDMDEFSASNLNRQLLCRTDNLGQPKIHAAKERGRLVNPEVEVVALNIKLTEANAEEVIGGHDIVLDAVDNVPTRLLLGECCGRLNLPLMHGAIQEWYLQASLVMPGSQLMQTLYAEASGESSLSCLSFTPAICASIQVAETVKYLLGRECSLVGKMLYMDLLDMDVDIIQL